MKPASMGPISFVGLDGTLPGFAAKHIAVSDQITVNGGPQFDAQLDRLVVASEQAVPSGWVSERTYKRVQAGFQEQSQTSPTRSVVLVVVSLNKKGVYDAHAFVQRHPVLHRPMTSASSDARRR